MKKSVLYIGIAVIVVAVIVCLCGWLVNGVAEEKLKAVDMERLASEDLTIDMERFSFGNETYINLSTCEVEGSGVKVSEAADGMKSIEITASGAYRVTGDLENGRILVNADDCDVNLILEGASITCLDSAPIFVYKSAATMITLEEGSVNALCDGSEYDYQDEYSSSVDEEPNACVYSKSDLIFLRYWKFDC